MPIELDLLVDKVFTDEDNRQYFSILDPDHVEKLYDVQRNFWAHRNNTKKFDQIIEQQAEDYTEGSLITLSMLLKSFVEKIRAEGRYKISILELGCANGVTLRHLGKTAGDLDVQFTGLELTPCLVDDFKKNFPDARVYIGGAEDLISMTEAELGSKSFDVCVLSGVLCQIPPKVVLTVLRFVGIYCDTILMWDYLMNLDGQLGLEHPIIFKHHPKAPHFLFSHPYQTFFSDSGFSIEDIQYSAGRQPVEVQLEGAVLARRVI